MSPGMPAPRRVRGSLTPDRGSHRGEKPSSTPEAGCGSVEPNMRFLAGEDVMTRSDASLELRTARPEEYPEVGELLVRVYVGEGHSPPERASGLRAVEPLA